MKKPRKPSVPPEPSEPQKKCPVIVHYIIYLERLPQCTLSAFADICLSKIVEYISYNLERDSIITRGVTKSALANIKAEDVYTYFNDSNGSYGDCASIECTWKPDISEVYQINENYEEQLKSYKKAMRMYEQKLAEYEPKLIEYKQKMVEYEKYKTEVLKKKQGIEIEKAKNILRKAGVKEIKL